MNKKILTLFSVIVLLAVLAWGVKSGVELQQKLRAKTTVTRMKMLMGVLQAERPVDVTGPSVRPLLEKYNRTECLEDAWGRPFVIEREASGAGAPVYRVLSYGRDGRRGPCCQHWVADWDSDAVLRGDEWLQVWYPEAAGTSG